MKREKPTQNNTETTKQLEVLKLIKTQETESTTNINNKKEVLGEIYQRNEE